MPLLVLTAAQEAAAEDALSSDLQFIFEEVGVRRPVQLVFSHLGYGRLARFAGLEDTKELVRAVIALDFGLDPAASLAARGDLADALSAWEATKIQLERENQLRAEQRVGGLTSAATPLELKGMLAAYTARHGRLETRLIPGRYMLGLKLEQIQANEPEIEKLEEIVSRADGDEEFVSTEVMRDGHIAVKKGSKKLVDPPAGAEELRTCYRVLTNAWVFVSSRHPNRRWMADFSAETYGQLADYLLGPKVAALESTVDPPRPDLGPSPSWQIVLGYELEIRKAAYEAVRADGLTLHNAIAVKMRCQEIRSLSLITPFNFQLNSSSSRNRDSAGSRVLLTANAATVKLERKVLASETLDGRKICYKYNKKDGVCDGTCGFVHCCQYCFKTNHGAPEHKFASSGGKKRGRAAAGKRLKQNRQ
jgi:hypothetical protein